MYFIVCAKAIKTCNLKLINDCLLIWPIRSLSKMEFPIFTQIFNRQASLDSSVNYKIIIIIEIYWQAPPLNLLMFCVCMCVCVSGFHTVKKEKWCVPTKYWKYNSKQIVCCLFFTHSFQCICISLSINGFTVHIDNVNSRWCKNWFRFV